MFLLWRRISFHGLPFAFGVAGFYKSCAVDSVAAYYEYFGGVVGFGVEGSAGQVGAGEPEAVAEGEGQGCDRKAVVKGVFGVEGVMELDVGGFDFPEGFGQGKAVYSGESCAIDADVAVFVFEGFLLFPVKVGCGVVPVGGFGSFYVDTEV